MTTRPMLYLAVLAHLAFIAWWAYALHHGAPQKLGGVMIGFSLVCGACATALLRKEAAKTAKGK